MIETAFIQCTGEPDRLHSTRIPRALWEEKRPQIIRLFKDFTLNEVIEKMKQDGFTAKYVNPSSAWYDQLLILYSFQSRRQYIYQLEQWGIKKYKAQCDKSFNADDAAGSKRKHDIVDTSPSSSSYVTKSSKRPKVAVEWEIGPEEDMLQTSAADNIERPVHATRTGLATKVSDSSYPSAERLPLVPGFDQDPAHQLWKLLHDSKACWYAGEKPYQITREVSRCVKAIRSQPEIRFWRVIDTLSNLESSKARHHREYLKDIGGYLCGIEKWDEAFEIYVLAYDDEGGSYVGSADLVSYVRSAKALEACQLAVSFLQEFDIRWWLDQGPLIIAHLVLARNLARHGMHADAKQQALAVQSLDKEAHLDFSNKGWSILTSIQDWFWFKVQKDCGLVSEALSITREDALGNSIWHRPSLATDLRLLRSALLDFSKIIREQWLDNEVEILGGGGANENEEFPLSVIFFQVLWHAQSEKPQDRWAMWAMGESNVVDGQCGRDSPLPDFLGTCCHILAGKATEWRLPGIPRTLKVWRDFLLKLDLGSIVSRMETRELHEAFLGCYCDRDEFLRSIQRGSPGDENDYRPPAESMTYLDKGKFSQSMELGGSGNPKQDPETSSTSPTTTARPTEPRESSESRAGNSAIDDSQLLSDTDMSSSFQSRLAPRGDDSVDNYYLDPTWGSPCRSSLASYGHMIEARAAMARSRKQGENCRLTKGAGGSLPSAMIRMDELSVSMGSVSLQDM